MQRREDLAAAAARLGRAAGPAVAARLQSPHAAASPRRPGRGGGGGGGARGPQPPPLLPPSATSSAPPAPSVAPTPLMPGAVSAAKSEPENKYLPELMAEKDSLDPSFTHAMQLLQAGTRAGRAGKAPCRSVPAQEARRAGGRAGPGGVG